MKIKHGVMRGGAALILGATVAGPLTGVPYAGAHRAVRADAFSFSGTTGAQHTVVLQGGRYVIGVFALYPGLPPTNYATCAFTATLNGVEHPIPGGQSVLGSLHVGAVFGYRYMPTLNLAAGHYVLNVSALTDCSWTVSIGGGGSGQPFASFGNTGIFHTLAGQNEKTTIVETNNTRYSFSFSYNAWGDGFNLPSASMDMLQSGRTLHTYTLKPSSGDNGQTAFSRDLTFPTSGGAKPGTYTARYNLVVGGRTFSKSVPYAVQALSPGTWAMQSAGTAMDLYGVACASATMCIAVTKAGTILATTDGRSWVRRNTPLGNATSITLSNVACPTVRTCYAAGDQYFILGSKDGGHTWSKQSGDDTFTSYGQDFIGVGCPSESRCYAVGRGGVIAATADGGAHWTMQATFGSGKDLTDVSCPTTTTCYVVGVGGTILHTSNGGTTWKRSTAGTAVLFSVDCPTARVCFATGQQGTIVHTGDGGTTWERQDNPINGSHLWVDSVSCSSTLLCHAVGNMGNLLITTDGGHSWHDQSTPVNKQLNVVSCAAAHTCYAVGSGGTIIKGA